LAKINLAVANKTLAKEQVLRDAFQYAKDNHKKKYTFRTCFRWRCSLPYFPFTWADRCYPEYGLKDVFVHAFTDGRDVDPKSGKNYIHT
jgi:2,3-bisphosphoglycerate-independent phosphoglycerate mutase